MEKRKPDGCVWATGWWRAKCPCVNSLSGNVSENSTYIFFFFCEQLQEKLLTRKNKHSWWESLSVLQPRTCIILLAAVLCGTFVTSAAQKTLKMTLAPINSKHQPLLIFLTIMLELFQSSSSAHYTGGSKGSSWVLWISKGSYLLGAVVSVVGFNIMGSSRGTS